MFLLLLTKKTTQNQWKNEQVCPFYFFEKKKAPKIFFQNLDGNEAIPYVVLFW